MTMNIVKTKEDFIVMLKEIKNTNVTYKQIAEKLNVKVNTLYTWIQKGNISDKKAEYLMKQVEKHFPEEYIYAVIKSSFYEVENELREEKESGNTLV